MSAEMAVSVDCEEGRHEACLATRANASRWCPCSCHQGGSAGVPAIVPAMPPAPSLQAALA